MDHATRVLSYVGGREFRAECSCGWLSSFARLHSAAQSFASKHTQHPDPAKFWTPVQTRPEEATMSQLIYRHPQGSTITVTDGVVEKRNPAGKKVSTSATAEALARGHGAWRLDREASNDVSTDYVRDLLGAPKAASNGSKTTKPAHLRAAPMRFESGDVTNVGKHIHDDTKVLQQKVDGVRALLDFTYGSDPSFRNSTGGELVHVGSSITVATILAKLPKKPPASEFSVDGEIADGIFWVFDLVVHGKETTPLIVRLMSLQSWHAEVVAAGLGDLIQLLPTAESEQEKRELIRTVQLNGGEGWMVKGQDTSYDWGSRVRHSLKLKLVKTAEAIVTARNTGGKENFTLSMWGPGGLVEVGQASAIGKPDAQVGEVVEVQYLYAGAQGRLVQPTVLKLRRDKSAAECVLSQLQFADRRVISHADLQAHRS